MVDVGFAVFASPDRARSLFTVRAAISFARPVLSPRCFALALMCSYCRSGLGLDPRGISHLPAAVAGARALTTACMYHGWRLPLSPRSMPAVLGFLQAVLGRAWMGPVMKPAGACR
jgi:hypothetical protein